ncbi:MAG: glycosyltransferase family 1 protein [Anaerolineales bacterium]|jgi:alpha-1,3-rhamnosyl/mannosyltransferase
MTLKICLDARTATDHFPGIGRYVSSLARSVVHQLDPGEELVIIHNPSAPSKWMMPPNDAGHVTLVPSNVSPFNPSQLWRVPALLRRNRGTLYHSPYYLMPYTPGIPAILTVYDVIPLRFPDYVSTQARLFFFMTTKLAVSVAKSLIAISSSTKKDYLKRFRILQNKIKVIPLAVSSDFRPQPKEEVSRVRNVYNLPKSFILYLGINKPHKNLTRLIDAWSLLVGERTGEYSLCIAGEWDERYPEPKRRVIQLGLQEQIKFLGPIKEQDLHGLYSAATIFVFPSLYEGFGLPVLEAMACGTPVACSNVSSLPEIVESAALLFDPNSYKSMAETLVSLIENRSLQDNLRELGFDQAKKYTWQRTASETLRIYRSLN